MNLKYNNIKYLFLFLLASQLVLAQFTPSFQNYSISDYNAGNQNWGLSKSQDGKLYVANNEGLLEFDGLKWSLWELPNKTTIRSVLAHNDKIYIGSYQEFGYWKKDAKGILCYSSLSKLIDEKKFFNEEFWEIIPYKESIVFRSFSAIYIYQNDIIKRISLPSTPMSCDIVEDKLYVSTLQDGIFMLKGEELVSLIDNDLLKGAKVISIVSLYNKLLITTSLNGCFQYANNRLTPWKSEINPIIKQHQLNSFVKLNNGDIIFGTIKNGIYKTDAFGNIVFHINKENGLINNTILGMNVDPNASGLWLGLDNGIASIDLNSAHSFYKDISGKLGAVYDVIMYRSTIYIGSNTGLYFLDKENKLQFIEGSQGQVWDLKEINGELFCGHNNGTYLIQENKLKEISNYTGGWVIKKVPEQKDIFIQGTYTGLVSFKKDKEEWKIKHLGKTTIPIRYLVFEDQYTMWVAHAYKGLYRIKFDKEYTEIIDIENYGDKGLLSDYNVRVYKLKNDICFRTNQGWQKYEPILDSIVPHGILNASFEDNTYIISEAEGDRLAFKNDNYISVRNLTDEENKIFIADRHFKNRLIIGNENFSKINDSISALNLIDGFMFINERNFPENHELEKPRIESISINNNPIELEANQRIEFPFRNNSISISMSSPLSKDHAFEYSYSNIDSSSWFKIEREKLELSNLLDGEYTMAFRTVNNFGNVSPKEVLKIKVLPPWYKAKEGFFLYGFLILISTLLFYLLHRRKINKEQKLLQLKLEREHGELIKEKALENDKKIIELKNQALKNEVTLKSKQLANTAMALVKKNEALLTLKKELILNKTNFDNHFSFKKLVRKIDGSIGHEDEWEIFEHNFNQVHEEFFHQLKEKFPDLTHKDLKICAYIKMNLSTKEIAPLMNISVRGVETHRYRLKKKLSLREDEALTAYLINFN